MTTFNARLLSKKSAAQFEVVSHFQPIDPAADAPKSRAREYLRRAAHAESRGCFALAKNFRVKAGWENP